MGAAKLFICGMENSLWLDGLSKDYMTQKVSVPFPASVKISAKEAAICNKLPVGKRTLMIRYRPDYGKSLERVRRHKKLKIFSVQICSKAK
jgi:hypothetical protein